MNDWLTVQLISTGCLQQTAIYLKWPSSVDALCIRTVTPQESFNWNGPTDNSSAYAKVNTAYILVTSVIKKQDTAPGLLNNNSNPPQYTPHIMPLHTLSCEQGFTNPQLGNETWILQAIKTTQKSNVCTQASSNSEWINAHALNPPYNTDHDRAQTRLWAVLGRQSYDRFITGPQILIKIWPY